MVIGHVRRFYHKSSFIQNFEQLDSGIEEFHPLKNYYEPHHEHVNSQQEILPQKFHHNLPCQNQNFEQLDSGTEEIHPIEYYFEPHH